jgi:hypothetical protein
VGVEEQLAIVRRKGMTSRQHSLAACFRRGSVHDDTDFGSMLFYVELVHPTVITL